MKNCLNYASSVEEHFDLQELTVIKSKKEMECLRCGVPIENSEKYNYQEKNRVEYIGNIMKFLENGKTFDIYHCPNCRNVEFFITES